jgi:hypothetical protein
MTDDKQPTASDQAFALLEQANKFIKIAPTVNDWEHDKADPTEEQISAARAILSSASALRRSLWALENVSEEIVKTHDAAQLARMDHFFKAEG